MNCGIMNRLKNVSELAGRIGMFILKLPGVTYLLWNEYHISINYMLDIILSLVYEIPIKKKKKKLNSHLFHSA